MEKFIDWSFRFAVVLAILTYLSYCSKYYDCEKKGGVFVQWSCLKVEKM